MTAAPSDVAPPGPRGRLVPVGHPRLTGRCSYCPALVPLDDDHAEPAAIGAGFQLRCDACKIAGRNAPDRFAALWRRVLSET